MKRPVIYWLATALLVAAASTVSYFVGKGQSDNVSDELLAELEALRSDQADAAVVKRVSQQMEDIAYLQKTVSDQERDRAEQQSELALAMRDRAEQESRIARDAEQKAVKAVADAEEQRAKALEHQQMAEVQRDAANHAKNVSDSLNYRAIGRTLGNTSITQYESGNKEVAGKLAYAGWYLLDTFGGNTYQAETYNSLKLCSNTQGSIQTLQKGAVRAFYPLYGIGCVTVTDYGEIEIHRTTGDRRNVILQNSAYDFRDVWSDGRDIYALSLHGPLCHTDFNQFINAIELPEGSYIKIQEMNDEEFLIAAKTHLLVFNKKNGSYYQHQQLPKELSTLARDDKGIILFFADGTAARLQQDMTTTSTDITGGKTATTAYYDKTMTGLFIGYSDGSIELFNKSGEKLTTILGHTGQVTDIVTVNNIMVSSSLDRNVCIWNATLFKLDNGKSLAKGLGVPAERLGIKNDAPSTEWPSPVTIPYPSWPLALCQFSPTEIVAGTADGEVYRFNVSTADMASVIKKNADISLSQDEWNRFIGRTVDYINIK